MIISKPVRPMLEGEFGPFSFALFMRAARTSLDLNQADMARKLQIARGTLCDIEKGRQLVSVQFAMRVAKKAGLSVPLAVEACLQDQLRKANFKGKVRVSAA
jgi:DNA-binding XRE family transcriptional regulator